MTVELRSDRFDPWLELSRYEARLRSGANGAAAVFVGSMRDINLGDEVHGLQLEHYPGMTEKHLEKIAAEATERWSLADCLVLHRTGDIAVGEPIVLVAAWTPHRDPAFQACRYIIEELKHRAPFWKRERLDRGSRWVVQNTPPADKPD
jgi:molybdopterin synthase catalytic subunit